MVEHEAKIRKVGDRLQRGGQLRRLDDKVVDKARLLQRGEAAPHVVPQQPIRIWLVLNKVADAD